MAFDSALLYYFVQDSLAGYSQDFQFIDRDNPVEFALNGHQYSVHVSFVHDSGNARSNDDETRIQMSRVQIDLQASRREHGARVAFIGFIENGQYFTAWDPDYVFGLQAETVVSVYARASMIRSASENTAAARRFRSNVAGTTFLTLALPASALGFYLENVSAFHGLQDENEVRNALAMNAEALTTTVASGNEPQEPVERRKFTYQRTAYQRDPKFTSAVLEAYENSCCVCGKQLAIVQAAHIVPHADADAVDTVQNGLALCIEHHRLYDDALLLPAPDGKLIVNEERAKYLVETKRSVGLDGVRELANSGYNLPKDAGKHPSAEYLQRGLKIRLGK